MSDARFSDLVGVTLTEITGLEKGSDSVSFIAPGKRWMMHHRQDCCESVDIEDVCGDASDLIGTPILRADEISLDSRTFDHPMDANDYSFTWTFYRISTIKGTVTIRWYGSSNGYYSEEVDFEEVAA